MEYWRSFFQKCGASAVTRTAFVFTLLAMLDCLLPAVPAQAQAARTFVSAAGSDSNNCTNVATPCRHFAAAYAATAANGEIDVLDPANYGALTITGPVSIEGHGWAAVSPPPGGSFSASIIINANAGDKINIIGVVLDGASSPDNAGIQFTSGGSLTVRDSVVRNCTAGILFEPSSSASTQIFVSNTLISGCAGGIQINPTGSGTTNGVFNHVQLVYNSGGPGLEFSTGFSTINLTLSDSVSASNAFGVAGYGGTAPVNIMVRNSTIANNSAYGLYALTNSTFRVTRSTITGNGSAWFGTVLSYGDNNIDGNGSINTEPPNPLSYQ
jgi:hypothetical protein